MIKMRAVAYLLLQQLRRLGRENALRKATGRMTCLRHRKVRLVGSWSTSQHTNLSPMMKYPMVPPWSRQIYLTPMIRVGIVCGRKFIPDSLLHRLNLSYLSRAIVALRGLRGTTVMGESCIMIRPLRLSISFLYMD